MSIIDHSAEDTFLILRASYVNICNGNLVAAALIQIFERWHVVKIKTRDQERSYRRSNAMQTPANVLIENLYQWHTSADLEKQLLGLGKRDKIQEARTQLVSMGIITEHKNPNPKFAFDRTTYFIFHPEAVQTYLELRREYPATENPQPTPPDSDRVTENRQRETENRDYTYNTSIDNDTDNDKKVPGAGAPGDIPPPIKPKKRRERATPGAGDVNWQRWVDAWHEFFKARHDGIEPAWSGSQLSSLKKLRLYLCKVAIGSTNGTLDDDGFTAWKYILDHWNELDDWQRQQFDIGVVYQKINNILTQLRNGTAKNRGIITGAKPGTSQARVDALANY